LNHNQTQRSTTSTPMIDLRYRNSISRKQISERIAKGLCQFCGDKWDRDHKQRCKVWGKLNAIFSAQEKMVVKVTSESDREQETELVKHSLNLLGDADVHISHSALQGVAGGNTLQMKGLIKKQVSVLFNGHEVHTILELLIG